MILKPWEKEYIVSNYSNILKQTITESVESVPNIWKDSIFNDMQPLASDIRGKWGEKLLFTFLKECKKFELKWDEDSNINASDGKYDLTVDGKRVEVKTAFRGSTNYSWQHENLYEEHVWDKVSFIDVDVNGIFFTVIDYDEISFKETHPIFNKTATLRKNRDDGYKFDLSKNNIIRGIRGGLTFYWDLTNDNDLYKFLIKKFS
jgi:hypothetical protein